MIQHQEYAKSLFELSSNINETLDEFQAFNELLSVYGFFDMLKAPNIGKTEKKALLEKALVDFSKTFLHFLYVLIDNNRINEIKDIYNEFFKMVCKKNNIEIVDLYLAKEINDSAETEITIKIEKTLNKKIVIKKHIDPAIIGGIRIEFDGKVIDDSVINQFIKIKSLL